MKCVMCENSKNLKKKNITYRYKECGLDNIVLVGLPTFKCEECGEEYYSYGNLENLHAKIADLLLTKSDLLIGKEIRFLRKHLGYSGAMFANLLGLSHETLSRIENGRQKVTETFDRLVRFAIANKIPDRDYDLHDLILKSEGHKSPRISLKQNSKGEWGMAA